MPTFIHPSVPQAGNSAREEILACIAAALGGKTDVYQNPDSEWEKLERQYIRTDQLAGKSVIELFEHRVCDYGARIFHSLIDQVAQTVANVLSDRQARQLVIPAGIPVEWLPQGFTFTEDRNLSYDVLNRFDGVLTLASVAIAATGSIVLQHGEARGAPLEHGGQGRRAITLIPDYHLCIVKTDQVVETVPAAFSRLDPARPTTFISGPSATADIEMTRIKGVHGPRFMDVILISSTNLDHRL